LRCCRHVPLDGRSSWLPRGTRTASGQMTLRMTTRRAQDLKRSANQLLSRRCVGKSSCRFLRVNRRGFRRPQDNVDMTQPSHYSAAPSGNLCTTSKQLSFVVQGESRRSVRITGEGPQPFRSGRVARGATVRVAVASTPVSSAWLSSPVSSSAVSSSATSPLATECSSSALGFAAWNAGKRAAAAVTREQMKHGCLDNVRGQLHGGAVVAHASVPAREPLVVEHARHGRRDSFTRNSFFT